MNTIKRLNLSLKGKPVGFVNRFVLLLFALLLWSGNAASQELIWHTDMSKAVDLATKENKKMLLFFTGSDWCGWCTKLEKEVFDTSDFATWSDDIVLVELDFPKRTPQDERTRGQNQNLQSMFGVRGYPTVFFVSPKVMPDGRTNLESLGRTGYVRGGSKKWLDIANKIVAKEL